MSTLFTNYYQCGNKQFYNIYQAFAHQKSTGHLPLYKIDQGLIDSISNFKRPSNLSIDYIQRLMINRLKKIRKKYRKMKIAYGGGTDSYTIVKLCIDNNIYIDEIVTQMVSIKKNIRTNLEYYAGINLVKKYEGTLIGKCTEIHPALDDLNFVNDPDWFYNENIVSGTNLPFRVYSLPTVINQALKDDKDAIVLTGHEKPTFLIENRKIHWCVIDSTCGEIMGTHNTVPFFLDKDNPELVVAMAYATLDNLDLNSMLSKDQLLGFGTFDVKTKLKLLNACGFLKTPHHFLNVGLLGKTKFNFNRKNQRFFNEIKKYGHQDYIDKIYKTHKRILNLYGDLPHAIETSGKFVKAIGRYSQKIPVLQDKFAS